MNVDLHHAAFVAVDVQNDFCPGGALAVFRGDEVVPVVNRLAAGFEICVATQDWHPAGHVSFASSHEGRRAYESDDSTKRSQTMWPDHCVQGSPGAAFHPRFEDRYYRMIVRKGFRKGLDSYSAFFENDAKTPTGLDGYLKGLGVKTVVLAGLALDYCVYFSVMDARRLGYKAIVVRDACRAVDLPVGHAERAVADMRARGALVMDAGEILS